MAQAGNLLLIDAGNSRMKWAVYGDGRLTGVDSLEYQTQSLSTQLQKCWSHFQDSSNVPQRILMSNVAGTPVEEAVREWADIQTPQVAVEIVIPSRQAHGVTNAYQDPESLGADRWAAMLAARQETTNAVCVVDCGSALTIDILDAEGKHHGGVIMPGMHMMVKSLMSETNLQHPNEPDRAARLGVDTGSAIHAGITVALTGAILQTLDYARSLLDCELDAIISGGNAEHLLPVLPEGFRYEPQLVLKGLAILAQGES